MENSESIKEIAPALLKAQSEMGNAVKDSSNPFFKSKYADLNSVREACIPILNQNGISAFQPMVHIEGKNFIKTILLHKSGEFISGLTEIVYSKQNDAQAQGSGITYARRYGLQSLVNIGSEDDDGNKASEPAKNNDVKVTEWLSEEQFLVAMGATKKGILATLATYNGQNGKGMKKDYLAKLTAQLENAI